jgi:hypothetical protein
MARGQTYRAPKAFNTVGKILPKILREAPGVPREERVR